MVKINRYGFTVGNVETRVSKPVPEKFAEENTEEIKKVVRIKYRDIMVNLLSSE